MGEKFSYSRIECFESCPYKYKLQYVDRIFCSGSNINTYYGSLVHKVLEMIAQKLQRNEKIDYDELKDYFVNADIPKKNRFDRDGDIFGTKKLSEMFHDKWFEVDKTGRNFLAKSEDFLESGIYSLENYMKDHPELELVGAEVSFEYVYRGYTFHGFIDRLLRYKEEPWKFVIHDIKTSSQAYDDRKLASPCQLYIYNCAMKEMYKEEYGDKVECECFYDFPIANDFRRGGTKGWEARCEKKLNKLLDGIESDNFEPKPSPLCAWCQFSPTNHDQPDEGKNKCPYYSLWTPQNRSFGVKLPWLGKEMDSIQIGKLIALSEIDSMNEDEIEI